MLLAYILLNRTYHRLFIILNNLTGQVQVIHCTRTVYIMYHNGLAKTWSFTQLRVPVDNGVKYHLLEMGLDLFNYLL
jgi:hypothetical protein